MQAIEAGDNAFHQIEPLNWRLDRLTLISSI